MFSQNLRNFLTIEKHAWIGDDPKDVRIKNN